MSNEWNTVKLEDVAAKIDRPFAMGPFGSNIKAINYQSAGVPVIRGINLNDVGGLPFNHSDFVYLSENKADELSSSSTFPSDIVFVAQGSVGRVGIIPKRTKYKKFILSQNLMKVTVNTDMADPLYVYYYFRSAMGQHEILSFMNPTGVPCISRPLTSLKDFKITLPSNVSEQKTIASILGALDDKIELNRKMNETLEAMARAVFKSWFVDFAPIPGFGPHKEWQDSPLGKIPKGWRVSTIGDMIELAYGRALKEEIRQPGKIPVYGSNGQVGWQNEKLVEGPGVVVGRKGNPGIVTWVPIDFYPIDTTFYVVPKSIIKSMHYLFHALKLQDIASLGADSAVPGLNRNMAYMNKMLVPSSDIVSAFDKQVKPLADKVKHNNDQSLTLAMIRNALLPKLLSGEIRVKGVERFVEPAT